MIELDGYTIQLMQEAARNQMEYWEEMKRPSMMLRPALTIDGNQWCALYGESLRDGNAGFGDTPELAYRDFDKNWFTYNIKNKEKSEKLDVQDELNRANDRIEELEERIQGLD